MPPLEEHDAVVLRNDRSLYGTVTRTSGDGSAPFDDLLIIGHVDIPLHVIHDFATKGTVPRGYVFVRFHDETLGHSLIPEDDLILLCRPLQIGQPVRLSRAGRMTGRVINVFDSYLLRPVVFEHSPVSSLAQCFEQPSDPVKCGQDCHPHLRLKVNHPYPHELIYDVPSKELKGALDVLQGDYVAHNDWVGIATDIHTEVVLALDDGSIVAVPEAVSLYLLLPDLDKPIIGMSEFDELVRPEYVVAVHGFSNTIPVTDPRRGQVVAFDPAHSLCRWLRGSYNDQIKPKGVVLDVRAEAMGISWLDANGFAGNSEHTRVPHITKRYYENPRTYKANTELRRKPDISIFDGGRVPQQSLPSSEGQPQHINKEQIDEHQDFRPGDRVKFRDAAAAVLKYSGSGDNNHGKYHRLSPHATDGWDLNELEVVHCTQTCLVRWQDGTETTESSTKLRRYALFEAEILPCDIVIKRNGIKQRDAPPMDLGQTMGLRSYRRRSEAQPFNEMSIMEKPHDIIPEKIGVVQSIDPTERVAKVRWFTKPRVEFLLSGYSLGPASRFGPIGNEVEDVSVYEIMTLPALELSIQDVATIPPATPTKKALKYFYKPHPHQSFASFAEIKARSLEPLYKERAMRCAEDVIRDRELYKAFKRNGSPNDDAVRSKFDWVARIIALNLDGSVIVRLGCENPSQDKVLHRDEIISVLDEDLVSEYDSDDDVNPFRDIIESDEDDQIDGKDVIEEAVEYEGGERMDEDSGDENWVSDEEASDDDLDEDEDNEYEQIEVENDVLNGSESDMPDLLSDDEEVKTVPRPPRPTESSSPLESLQKCLPAAAPAQFEILADNPPPDQYGIQSSSAKHAATFIKQMMREHKILASALPKNEIYVRTYESRLDLMRCLIIGPKDTPYEFAPLMIDFHIEPTFPQQPPKAYFYSWSGGIGRINPNLYEEGRICLSLLGTWPGQAKNEGWTPDATILQILVSIQGLVLVKSPFYNEAGFEGYEGEKQYVTESLQYSEKAFVVARGFLKHGLFTPPQSIRDILAWLYLPHQRETSDAASTSRSSKYSTSWPGDSLLERVLDRSYSLIEASESLTKSSTEKDSRSTEERILVDGSGQTGQISAFLAPLSKGALVMLRRITTELEAALERLAIDEVGDSGGVQNRNLERSMSVDMGNT